MVDTGEQRTQFEINKLQPIDKNWQKSPKLHCDTINNLQKNETSRWVRYIILYELPPFSLKVTMSMNFEYPTTKPNGPNHKKKS